MKPHNQYDQEELGSDLPWAEGDPQNGSSVARMARDARPRKRASDAFEQGSGSGDFGGATAEKSTRNVPPKGLWGRLWAAIWPDSGDGTSLMAWLFSGDRVLWIITAMLAVLSVLVVYSSTAKMGYDAHTLRSTSHYLQQQLILLLICVFIVIIAQKINTIFYKRATYLGYLVSICMTMAVYFMNVETNGAARWFPIGPFQFQPSEALKVATILFMARQLAKYQKNISTLRIIPSLKFWTWRSSAEQRKIWNTGTWPILMPVLCSCLVIFPAHTSSALLIFGVTWVMMLIGRVKLTELLKLVGLAFAAGLIVLNLNLGRSQTAEGRFSTWIHLWTQSQVDKPVEHLTDTERSMIAIHNGGILGKGAGQSTMRVEMIHPESDYAYAFFVEEYGTLFAIMLLLLYLWLFFRAIEIFRRSHDRFAGLMSLGLGLQIICQALLHIMVTLNLSPETGQTLPLISRGGTSMIFTALSLSLILGVSRENDQYVEPTKTPKNQVDNGTN